MGRRRFSENALAAKLMEFDGRCGICGEPVGGRTKTRIHWDHIIPIEMGGRDDIDNLQPAHVDCHAEKTRKDVKQIAKAKRMSRREMGIPRQGRRSIPGGRDDKWKRKVGGGTVLRDED